MNQNKTEKEEVFPVEEHMTSSAGSSVFDVTPILHEDCLYCEYSLAGHSVTGHCPECGQPFDKREGIWRDRKKLVFLKRLQLPQRCIKCNSSERVKMKKHTLYCVPWWVYLIAILLLVVTSGAGIILVLLMAIFVQKKAKVRLGLCRKHRFLRLMTNGFIFFGFFGSIALIIAGAGADPDGSSLVIPGLIGLPLSMIAALIWGHLVVAKKIDKTYIHMKGCCVNFLKHYPEWD